MAATPWLSRLPRGDGHPVMVFPGMGANDLTTIPLRRFLRRLGYVTQAWGQGLNFGPRRGVLRRCAADVQALAERHGQPVSLIGWSLGGLYAREMAKELPDHTRCVVTLGTPFAGDPKATNAWRVYELLSGQSAHDPVMHEKLRTAPTVPTTSIYSRTDGIVAWQCSLNEPGPHHREHRSARQPRRHGCEPAGAVCSRRSPGSAGRCVEARSRCAGCGACCTRRRRAVEA